MTVSEALAWARAELAEVSDSPRLDAEVLLGRALGASRAQLYARPERELSDAERERFRADVGRRRAGWPIAYITGEQEFWSLPLEVSPATLIPRPDTELLVEQALLRLPPAPARALDLGTGSGAIALALASERLQLQVVAVDISEEALAVARRNRDRLGLTDRVEFRAGDWFAPVAGERFHLIAANPPYIGPDEPEPYQGGVRYEPRGALVAPEQGLAALRHIIAGAPAHLEPGGHLLVEHGWRQGEAVRALLRAHGFADVITYRDLQGHERTTAGRWGG